VAVCRHSPVDVISISMCNVICMCFSSVAVQLFVAAGYSNTVGLRTQHVLVQSCLRTLRPVRPSPSSSAGDLLSWRSAHTDRLRRHARATRTRRAFRRQRHSTQRNQARSAAYSGPIACRGRSSSRNIWPVLTRRLPAVYRPKYTKHADDYRLHIGCI